MSGEARDAIERDDLALFVRESNWIEGIRRDPTEAEIEAHRVFLALPEATLDAMVDLVAALQPDARLRDRQGLNVYVGEHVPPPGGYGIALALCDLLGRATDAFQTHVEYETLHPFTDGNGRSGRALWLRMMGDAPLGFLHHWYYQSLSNSGFCGKADTRALPPEQPEEAEKYLSDRFEWAAPGDQQEDAWLVRFCDKDCGEAIFTGPEAESEAWAYWNRYAPSYNIYVFRLAAMRAARPASGREGGE